MSKPTNIEHESQDRVGLTPVTDAELDHVSGGQGQGAIVQFPPGETPGSTDARGGPFPDSIDLRNGGVIGLEHGKPGAT